MPVKRWREFHRTPHDPVHQMVLDNLNGAKHSLHGDFYGITDADVIDIFIAKHQSGLAVGIVADKSQSAGAKQRAQLQRAVDAGVEVVITMSPLDQINHSKHALVDIVLGADANESYALYGSLNLSGTGEKQENFIMLDNDPTICTDLYQQYLEARDFGLKHPQWQLHPTNVTPQPVPADVAAAPAPPEQPEPTP